MAREIIKSLDNMVSKYEDLKEKNVNTDFVRETGFLFIEMLYEAGELSDLEYGNYRDKLDLA